MKVEDLAKLRDGTYRSMEIAGTLAMCSGKEIGKLIQLARTIRDKSAIHQIQQTVADSLSVLYPDHATELSIAITREIVEVNHCFHCNGHGKIKKLVGSGNDADIVLCECESCKGVGFHHWSQRARIKASGIARGTWRRYRFDNIIESYCANLDKMAGEVADQLRKH
ncbi:hypothetical protein ABXV18_27045 [Vibrio owensii]|uniref:hypothetical protein n=1 Tax=Vibrio owensii TaxID=696485 RepID=UPI0033944849